VLELPGLSFRSDRMWIDAGRIWFTTNGHLLSVPLPKQ
jgi:hypothetical protein